MIPSDSQHNPNQELHDATPAPARSRRYILWAGLLPVMVVGMFFLFGWFRPKEMATIAPIVSDIVQSVDTLPSPSPTPFLFREMTIPGLRDRSYSSTLGPLQQVAQYAAYTSYLTTYTSDGLTINAQLTQPTGTVPEGGWPAVVFVHGYIPPRQYQTLEKYTAYVDYLARNGLVVLKTDLRGHGNSQGEPGGGYYSADYVIDTLNARAALQTAPFVNPKAIGLWGHSMAGNVTLRATAAQPEIPATVIWAGAGFTYVDLREYRISDSSYQPQPTGTATSRRRQQISATYGTPTPDHPFWKQMMPTNYLSDIKGAIALHHAVNDDVVSVNYSRNLNTILDSTTIPHELYEYPTGGHNITDPSFGIAMQRTVAFFQKHLAVANTRSRE